MENQTTRNRILVVEDEEDIARLLKIHLCDIAFEVDVVNNGVDGLNRACNTEYSLIVLDLMLPRMDGLEVCRRLSTQSINTPYYCFHSCLQFFF